MSNASTPVMPLSCVIGIGASAGGSFALREFFARVSSQRLTFVVLEHLDVNSEHLALETLKLFTNMPVRSITPGLEIEAGQVYLAAPHNIVTIEHGHFQTQAAEGGDQRRSTIDHFFSSLADTYKQRSVGIIFSGEGSDGAEGVKAIADAGGMTLAQTPDSADHRSMPEAAIETGAVDVILPPADMGDEILAYEKYLLRLLDQTRISILRDQIAAALSSICECMHKATGHDFKHYKTNTLVRRIQRRMQILQLKSVADYVERLNERSEEVDALFKELLINVTSFFRDADAFEALRTLVLEKQLHKHTGNQKYRVWIAGCSTGEEAYSLAILVTEIISEMKRPPEVQIIATDIDEVALNAARRGSYAASIADDVSPERLKRFFIRKAGRYIVTKELREMCLFSLHNLINDPPFSQIDLLTCRNVLIYLGPHLQQKLIPVFHYALKPSGNLFLGTSESLTGHQDLFRTVNTKYRIAERRATAIKSPAHLGSMGNFAAPRSSLEPLQTTEMDLTLIGQRIILDEFAPRYAIVNEEGQILSVSAGVHRYFEPSEGTFHNNILKLVSPPLRSALRTTFKEADKVKRKIVHEGSTIEIDGVPQRIGIVVQPMPQLGEGLGLYMVVFQYLGQQVIREGSGETRESSLANAAVVEQLERELVLMREDLDKTVQDLEASNEELKSSNEELLSMNEELQSANEELETSKEDVQAANEALLRSNADLENLLAGTDIATLFLDDHHRIKSFTPAIARFYRLMQSDIGREIEVFQTLALNMPPYPLRRDLGISEHTTAEVMLPDGHIYLRRIIAYKTHDGRQDGLVVTFVDITDLRRSEGRLATMANLVPSIIWMSDSNGRIDYFNSRWYEYTGHPLEIEFMPGAGWLEYVHPDDIMRVENHWQTAIEGGSGFESEFRLKHRDGAYRWHLCRSVPVKDSNGAVAQWLGTVNDIDAQRVEVDILKESGEGLRTIVETIPQYIWRTTPDGAVDYCSESFVRFVGLPRDQILGWGWLDIIHPDDRDLVATEWQGARDSQGPMEVEFRLQLHRGERWVRSQGNPFFDSNGRLSKYYGTWTDIHDKIEARLMIERSETRFRALAEAMPQIVFTGDKQGNINYFNKRFMEYTGLSFEALRDWGWKLVVHPSDLQRTVETWLASIQTGRPYEIEYRIKRHDGAYRWFLGRAYQDLENEDNGTSWYGTNTDIHDWKMLSEELLAAKDVAEIANQTKSRFLANMSHEIRTPLGVIMGFNDLLKEQLLGKPDLSVYVERIASNASQLGNLIDEILDLSKIEANRLEAEFKSVSLRCILSDVFEGMKVMAKDKGLVFAETWSTPEPESIVTDALKFRQILINVIGNAVKFTDRGRIDINLATRQVEDGYQLEVAVKDTGIGLSPEQQGRIFEPFIQADSSVTRRFGGTGLGLALSSRLANLLGGSLVLESSAVGQGSVFKILIGIGETLAAPSTGDKVVAARRSRDRYPTLAANLRILVVDDSGDNRAIVGRFIKLAGAQFDTAENGEIAVSKAQSDHFDVILMDIQMPVLDGYQALAKLKAQGYQKPIIALTAHAMKEERDRCLAAGFNAYLSKPVDRSALLQMIVDFSRSAL